MLLIGTVKKKNSQLSSLNICGAWNYICDGFDNVIKSNIHTLFYATCMKNIYMTQEAMWLKNSKYQFWRKYFATQDQADHYAFVCVRNELQSLTRSPHQDFEQSITASVKHTQSFLALGQVLF